MESVNIQFQPFFEWLLRTTVQASVLICLILLVQLILGGRLGIRWRYCLWIVLLIRMAMPWAPQSRVSMFNLIPQSVPQRQTEYARTEVSDDNVESDVAEKASSESTPLPKTDTPPETAEPITVTPVMRKEAADQLKPVFLEVANVLPLVWLAGVLVLAVYVCAGNFNLWRIVIRERPLTDQGILDLLEDCKSQMGIRTIMGVVVTDKVKSPALFGFIRPRLLQPKGMLEALSREELRYVFLHELAHLKRHDIYVGYLSSLLQVLHWFNPFVWLAFYQMRADRELACDALVLARTQSSQASDYGRTIVSFLERFSRSQRLSAMAGILETKTQLKRRITMIARFKKNSYQWSPLAIILIILLACVSLPDARRAKASGIPAAEPETVSEAASQPTPVDPGIEGLVAYYAMENDVLDGSGNGNDGTIVGDPVFVDGPPGYGMAMEFDGDDYVDCGNTENLATWTIACWAKSPAAPSGDLSSGPVHRQKNYQLNWNHHTEKSRGAAVLRVGGSLQWHAAKYEPLEADTWYHLAATYDGEDLKAYRDGELITTNDAPSGPPDDEPESLKLARHAAEARYFTGTVDEAIIYNRALSVGEIRYLAGFRAPVEVIERSVAAYDDDAEEHVLKGGSMEFLGSTDLELGYEKEKALGNLQTVGIRLRDIQIPQGATITSAWAQFSADSVNRDFHIPDVSVIIEGEASPNPATFSTNAGDISSRLVTTASVVWDIPQWMETHLRGPDEQTPDISAIIQEIVDQPDWAAGNAIVLLFRDNPDNPSQGTREAESFDGAMNDHAGDMTLPPLLHIEYEAIGAIEPPAPADVTAPGDTVKGVPNDGLTDGSRNFGWKSWESPDMAIDDNTATKYLHFKGETETTGFQVTPTSGPSIVTGLTLTTANDFPARDPIAFELSGSNESIDGPYELIASDYIVDFAQEAEWPRFTMNATPISFDNDVAYAHYQVLFPAVRDAGSANSMQIAEVELLGIPAPAAPGSVAHWKLDEGSGTIAADSSGNGLDGTLIGDPLWVAGIIGGALEFDGVDDYVNIDDYKGICVDPADPNSLQPAFSISCWFKTTGNGEIVSWGTDGSGTRLSFRVKGGRIRTEHGAGNIQGDITCNDGQWHHFALTVTEGAAVSTPDAQLWLDGVYDLRASTVGDTDTYNLTPGEDVSIGRRAVRDDRYFPGTIDDVRIYDRALSEAEIAALASGQ